MLILKRKMGEGIDVGDNVRIVLKEISGGHVKIGIEAPTDIRVRRSETATSIEAENLKAANSCIQGAGDLECLKGLAGVRCRGSAGCGRQAMEGGLEAGAGGRWPVEASNA